MGANAASRPVSSRDVLLWCMGVLLSTGGEWGLASGGGQSCFVEASLGNSLWQRSACLSLLTQHSPGFLWKSL